MRSYFTSPTGTVAKYYNERVCVSVCMCVSVCLSVRLSVWERGYLRNDTRNLYQVFMHVAYCHGSVLLRQGKLEEIPFMKTHLFWGQKVKGQGHESQQTLPAWVFALLWVLASFSSRYVDTAGTSVKQGAECFVYWKDPKTQQFWGLNFIDADDARRFRDCCTVRHL